MLDRSSIVLFVFNLNVTQWHLHREHDPSRFGLEDTKRRLHVRDGRELAYRMIPAFWSILMLRIYAFPSADGKYRTVLSLICIMMKLPQFFFNSWLLHSIRVIHLTALCNNIIYSLT